jgi:uncharacterized protein
MIETITICLAALVASVLTFFSGFGLGTILTPVFAIFFPIEISVALTAIVHFLNNLFKLVLVGKHTDKQVALRFGVPAFFAAFLGAYLLTKISDWKPLLSYELGSQEYVITPVKVIIAILLIFFALMEVVPFLRNVKFDRDKLIPGGVLSGFFGGLSGHQGALRSAFLIKANLSKESFIATGVVIACLVDVSRLTVYSSTFLPSGLSDNLDIILFATLSAFVGAFVGSKVLQKVTFTSIQVIVSIMLIALSILIGLGIV